MRTLTLAILFMALAFLTAGASAVQAQPAPAQTQTQAPAATGQPLAVQPSVLPAVTRSAAPVPVPVADGRTMGYYRSGFLVFLGNYLSALLTSVLVLFTGLSARLRNIAYKIGRFQIPAILVYIFLFAIIDFVIGLPFAYYNFARDQRYGLNAETFAAWFKGELLSVPGGVLFVAILMVAFYTILRFSPRRWWLYVAIPLFLADAGSNFVSLIMQPQSKGFGPVKDAALAADIGTLAARAGVANAGVFQATNVENGAVVSRWMGKTRIVIPDPAESKLTRSEQLYLVARGLGAYRLHDLLKYYFLRALLSILAFYLLYRTSLLLIARFKDQWGFEKLSDIASWPLFPVLFNIFFLVVQPVGAAYSRHLHHQTDLFGLELAQDNRACAESFIALSSSKLTNPNPGPIYRVWRSFDPPLAERVEFCNAYRPWERGEPLEYGHLIAAPRLSRLATP
jgi:STE24 endopeptidase